jgi:hypothetical protein
LADLVTRFILGGLIVSIFALIGDLLKPKSFAGLFGGAPSVALASLGLTIASQGKIYASIECRSMLLGALALGIYSSVVSWLLMRRRAGPLRAALLSMISWFSVALGLWFVLLGGAA